MLFSIATKWMVPWSSVNWLATGGIWKWLATGGAWKTHPQLKGKSHPHKISHSSHGSLTRGDNRCHEGPALIRLTLPVSPAPNGHPGVLPHLGSPPLSLSLTPKSPNSYYLSWQFLIKSIKGGCSRSWLNLFGRMWVTQSHRMLMWDLEVAGRHACSLLCCAAPWAAAIELPYRCQTRP